MKTITTWETIVDTLIQEFEHDGYKKGEKMPSESKMAARFDTTRTEVRKAYLHLEEKATSTLCKATEAFSLERKKRSACS
ncbi:MAG: GntR family transcriptional regulator [Faecalimonas umbilicata]